MRLLLFLPASRCDVTGIAEVQVLQHGCALQQLLQTHTAVDLSCRELWQGHGCSWRGVQVQLLQPAKSCHAFWQLDALRFERLQALALLGCQQQGVGGEEVQAEVRKPLESSRQLQLHWLQAAVAA
jgi:hypothetical protein